MRTPIQWKITSLIVFILGFSLIFLGIILINEFTHKEQNKIREKAMLTARTVSELPEVIVHLSEDNQELEVLQKTVEKIRMINNADYIVVMDMNRIRHTHPNKELVGKVSDGLDEGAAFAEHSYLSEAIGEIGSVVRAFVPVIDEDHQQVGVIMVGYKLPSLFDTLMNVKKEILLSGGIAFLFGGWGAWVLARHIKREMFQLEPHEIARLVVERTEAFNAMHEGIIAIDRHEKITIFNNRAKEILGVEEEVIGRDITEVLPETYLPEILHIAEPIYNKDLYINNLMIVSNRVPIKVDNKIVGAIAIFQDRTNVKKLAEELTGVKAFVNALRVQNHEHINKLHTIAGLIQLGNRDKALQYVFQVTEEQEELTRFLSKNIHDDSLSGLLLSKVSRGKELGIQVIIDRNSYLREFPNLLDHHDFVLMVGNLIENAYDSFHQSHADCKEIYVSIRQSDKLLTILVEDNGCGIPEANLASIFSYGYSSKSGPGRGIGLFLVQQIVEKGKGFIHVDSILGEGTSFQITFEHELAN
ncbi:ATP-binding protein [Bacillus marasmi]|uniref:ATP-binding protein n=1 Tax=Bacillus marasmi TaxID=1926279 RepID=UPI0011CA5156|nr:sensor histidine kinase [Bacillus marasmi]